MDITEMKICPYELKELNKIIYQKLQYLIVGFPPTEDKFRQILSAEMFTVSNIEVFLQVMHYLLRLLNPLEFKKRFLWPIVDKKTEALFRSTAVDYLNHLRSKHELNWPPIKSYIFVKFNNVKFLSFLNDLINFVVREKSKILKKSCGISDSSKQRKSVQEINHDHSMFMAEAKIVAETFVHQTKQLKEKSSMIREKLKEISNSTNISLETFLNMTIIQELEERNEKLYEEKILKKTEEFKSFQKDTEEMKCNFETLIKGKPKLSFDPHELINSFEIVKGTFPNIKGIILQKNKVDINCALEACKSILPYIDWALSKANEENFGMEEIEFNDILKIRNELEEVADEYLNFEKEISKVNEQLRYENSKENIKVNKDNEMTFISLIQDKFVYTPPARIKDIKMNSLRPLLLSDELPRPSETGPLSLNNKFFKKTESFREKDSKLNSKSSTGISSGEQMLKSVLIKSCPWNKQKRELDKSVKIPKWRDREVLMSFDHDDDNQDLNWITSKNKNRNNELNRSKSDLDSSYATGFNPVNDKSNFLYDPIIRAKKRLASCIKQAKQTPSKNLSTIDVHTSPSGYLECLIDRTDSAKHVRNQEIDEITELSDGFDKVNLEYSYSSLPEGE